MRGYDPFTYRPMMRFFYGGGPLPQDVTVAAQDNPGAAQHLQSVFAFQEWLKSNFPNVHGAILARNPQALDIVQSVMSGRVAPSGTAPQKSGLGGFGDLVDSQPATDWGKTIASIAQSLVSAKGQNDLIKLNISRAEQGLPPIDAGAIAPQVNLGVSADVQKLVIYGIGAALVLGLMTAYK